MVRLKNKWDEILAEEFKKEYYLKLREFLKQEYTHYTVYPDMNNIFNSLKYADYDGIKAVIIGQDPYHEPNQAHGLAFSVLKGNPIPPSLKNIYKEISDDLGLAAPSHGELTYWAKQGVLLLNSALTVRRGQANSHRGKGWEQFTDAVISKVNQKDSPVVYLLWGANAREKARLINNPKHLILTAAHPSPLSAFNGFFGCKHFSKCNAFLQQQGIQPVDWSIRD
ncbi:MAG: uracil-DNA glycosylase [Firmicutes bacterium]|nr:uracil-DNA glycosylase [[Eubacterium] siraeum]MCM1488627.1 uracil-DNA glycosylase [Bacillota bacterium]